MSARKFRIICDGKFRGFLFISDYNGNYDCKIGTIAPFSLEVNDNGDSEIIGLEHVIDIYLPETPDENIKSSLMERVTFNNCAKIEIFPIE